MAQAALPEALEACPELAEGARRRSFREPQQTARAGFFHSLSGRAGTSQEFPKLFERDSCLPNDTCQSAETNPSMPWNAHSEAVFAAN